MPDPTPSWSLHSTPNPSEKSFSVTVPMTEIAHKMTEFLAYAEGSIFRNFPLIPEQSLAYDDQFGLYVYTISRDTDNSAIQWFFGRPKTSTVIGSADNPNTPFRSTWKKHGNHRWPPILKGLVLLEDFFFPRSTNVISAGQSGVATGPSYYDRYIYIPDVNEGTRFLLQEFFSSAPFQIPRYRTPVATGVQYNVNGLSGSFQECLHDDVSIPSTRTSNATYFTGAGELGGSGSIEGQFFPRTNFKTWIPYVLYDEQEQRDGGWYRQRIRVYPPLKPKAIRR